jgi:hypothetical protein
MFPGAERYLVAKTFDWASACFTGQYRNYQAIDAKYHDFEHTLQVTLCFVRLLHGWLKAGAEPHVTPKAFELGLQAIILHDTGYLKTNDDLEGTGAKYTLVHVNRSAEFARAFLAERGYSPGDIASVQNMIRCTGLNAKISLIPFHGELERRLGCALSTADLLGQMAADDYIDKLPILYQEFEESARYNSGKGSAVGVFSSARDLMSKTPAFWEKYVVPKLDADYLGLYRFLNLPYPDGPNYYIRKIEANLVRLQERLAATPQS